MSEPSVLSNFLADYPPRGQMVSLINKVVPIYQAAALCRFVETVAYKAFRDTGRMQYSEFGTQISGPKAIWNTLLGLTGLGQGARSPALLMPSQWMS
jgi:hypothetical protein